MNSMKLLYSRCHRNDTHKALYNKKKLISNSPEAITNNRRHEINIKDACEAKRVKMKPRGNSTDPMIRL